MSADIDRAVRDNDRLTRELRSAKERLSAIESSRWWRLNPRTALRRLRLRDDRADDSRHAPEVSFPGDFGPADIEVCRRVAPYTMTQPARLYALMRAVEYVVARALPGAFVECGVWRGGSMMAVALTLLRSGETNRDLYLFDTFAGMTPPTVEDVKYTGESAADLLVDSPRDSDLWAVASLDDVREAVLGVGYPQARIHLVEGPVEETLPDNAPDEIALLRLDTDWYESTKHELIHLFPRLTRDGVLLLDDYGYWQGTRRATDEYVAEHDVQLLLNRIDAGARIAIKSAPTPG